MVFWGIRKEAQDSKGTWLTNIGSCPINCSSVARYVEFCTKKKSPEIWVSDSWYLAQQYYMWEGSGCSGQPQIKHKLAGCSAAKRINAIVSCQQRNGGGIDSSSLCSAGLTTPGILCLVLVTAIQEGYLWTGKTDECKEEGRGLKS